MFHVLRCSHVSEAVKKPREVTAAPLRSLVRMSRILCASMAEWKRFTRTAEAYQGPCDSEASILQREVFQHNTCCLCGRWVGGEIVQAMAYDNPIPGFDARRWRKRVERLVSVRLHTFPKPRTPTTQTTCDFGELVLARTGFKHASDSHDSDDFC